MFWSFSLHAELFPWHKKGKLPNKQTLSLFASFSMTGLVLPDVLDPTVNSICGETDDGFTSCRTATMT